MMKDGIKRLLLIAVVIAVVAICYWGINAVVTAYTAHDLWVFGAGFATCWGIDFILTLASGKKSKKATGSANGSAVK